MSSMLSYWLPTLIVILLILVGLGVWINGRYLGILIDSRRKMSLSRFQVVLWSWLIISTFLAVGLAKGTMNIAMAPEIWALMGISFGSAAGAVIVKGAKQKSHLLHEKDNIQSADPSDMFKGEENTDEAYVDITKVQMFFFTVAILLGYLAALWGYDFKPDEHGAISFPPLSAQLVTILGISHAGYLTVKAAPKA